jgi:hypothetical protein
LCKHLSPDKAIDFFKDLYKLEKEEKENTRFAKYKTVKDRAGTMTSQYSEGAIKVALKGFFGKPPTIDQYTEEELESIIVAIYDANLAVRSNIDDVVMMSMIDNVFMTICGIFNKERLTSQRKLDYA